MSEIGKRLKTYRLRKNLSVKKVADLVGIPPSTYRDWEYGRLIMGEPYEKLAGVFDVSITELVTGREPELSETIKSLESALADLRCRV